jgi:EAL domain-containing protein (putative c-di-GMP-specific phosphodiesterase class I)
VSVDQDSATAVERVLASGGPSIVCQPVVELETRTIVGYEALARFAEAPLRPPDVWFAEAASQGLGVELELNAVDAALALLDRLPDGVHLAFNASPATVLTPEFAERLGALGRLDRLGCSRSRLPSCARPAHGCAMPWSGSRLHARSARAPMSELGLP